MPSTVSATITIVANTGWLIATRVIHMASARVCRRRLDRARAAVVFQARGLAVLQVVELGGDHVIARLQPREHFHQVRALVARAEGHRPPLEATAGEEPDIALRALAADRRFGQSRRLALSGEGQAYAREHARLQQRVLVCERNINMNGARAGLGARVDALDPADEAVPRQALDRYARRHAGRDARHVRERSLNLHFQVRE